MVRGTREASVTYAAVLRHLKEAPLPDYPSPPRGKVLRLSLLVSFFRVFIGLLLPVLGVTLFFTPLAVKLLTGEGYLKPFRNVFGLAAIWLFVAWYRAFVRKQKVEVDDVVLSRRVDYKVYELADAVAVAVGSPSVDKISMSPTASFAVEEERIDGRRTLHLKLSSHDFESLTLAQFAAILAREVAHFGRGHTRHSFRLSRDLHFLLELDDELKKTNWRLANPAYWALRLFERLFDPLLAAIQRDYVKQADAAAIDLFGASAFSASFRKEVQSRVRGAWLMPSKLVIVEESAKHEPSLLSLIATHEFDSEGYAEYAARFEELLERPTQVLDTEPSIRDRLEFATQRRAERPELAGLADLSGSESAYAYLFEGRWSEIESAISNRIVSRETGYVDTEIGLRGEPVDGPVTRSLPDVTVLKHTTPVFLMRLLTTSFGVLMFGVLLLTIEMSEIIPRNLFGVFVAGELVFALALVYVIRARAMLVHASESGLTIVSLLHSTRLEWEEVTGLRSGNSKLSVFANSNGGLHRITLNGEAEDRSRMADMILELSPALAYVAWGTGLARAPRPPATAALPSRVYQRGGTIHIEGPGETRIVVEEDEAHYETTLDSIERRLLPLMLEG